MKIIGDQNLFAIAYNLDFVRPDNYFGNIWFWINNKRIGADDANTYLSSSVHFLKQFFELKPLRRYLGSEKLSAKELFHKLCEIFNTDESTSANNYLNFNIIRDIFWLESIGDANFRDDVKLILIDEPEMNRQRFIWKRYEDELLNEYFIPYNCFEMVCNEFINQIEEDVVSKKSL